MQAQYALLNRVSAARLIEPAPSAEQRALMFQAAMRAPDHAQLRPWRFLCVEGDARIEMGELFASALLNQDPATESAKLEKARHMPLRAPLIVVAIASFKPHPKVPYSEQRLTVGCAVHSMTLAAFSEGLGAIWRTGELAHDEFVAKGLGLTGDEEILGFLYLGTPAAALRQAPVLDPAPFIQNWP